MNGCQAATKVVFGGFLRQSNAVFRSNIRRVVPLMAMMLGFVLPWTSLLAQDSPANTPPVAEPVLSSAIPLWPNGAPGALGDGDRDTPAITKYLPERSAEDTNLLAAVVIFPGGGYGGLAGHEGRDYALFLNQHGIAAFVVRYRLGSAGYRHPIMLNDAARAVRWVRHNAKELGVDPHRIGIMGSSAGGHLASTLLVRFDSGDVAAADPMDRVSSRPDFGILCYPVISMGRHTHVGSKQNLLGERPPNSLVEELSNELHVRPTTPPVFLWHTWEDQAVAVENALMFATALRQEGVSFDLHIYAKGRHGIGLQATPPEFENPHPWTNDLLFWLREQKFAE